MIATISRDKPLKIFSPKQLYLWVGWGRQRGWVVDYLWRSCWAIHHLVMLRKSEPQRARDTSSCNNRRNNPRKHNIHNKQIVTNQCLIDFSIKHWFQYDTWGLCWWWWQRWGDEGWQIVRWRWWCQAGMKWTWNRETARSLAVDSEFPNVSRVTPKKSQRPGRYLDDFWEISGGEQRLIFVHLSQ